MTLDAGPFRSLFRPQQEIYDEAYEGRQFDAVYLLMLVLSCLIALIGLLLNSPAVIIGAMLISPLMGPILSCALALSLADVSLGRKAALNASLSVVETIAIAVVATLLSPLRDATPEILARTHPNLMDLLVAFFSGIAGTLAFCARRSGALTILPGVAIATALMPPLATTGYGISTGQWQVARGAFMLFFTNFTAIVISADIVFFVAGFRTRHRLGRDVYPSFLRYRVLAAGATLALLSVPLVRTLHRASAQARARSASLSVLASALDQTGRRALGNVDVRAEEDDVLVQASVRTVDFIPESQVQELERALAQQVGRPVHLDLQQIQIARPEPVRKAADAPDFLGGGQIPSAPVAPEPSLDELLAALEGKVRSSVAFLTQKEQPIDVRSVAREAGGLVRLELFCSMDDALPEGRYWELLAAALARELDTAVRIHGAALRPLPGAGTIHFEKASSRAAATDVKKVAAAFRSWSDHPGLRLAFVPSAGAPADLSERRLAALTTRFEGGLPGTAGAAGPTEAEVVAVYLVQQFQAEAGPGPAASPTAQAAPSSPGAAETSTPPLK